MSILTAYDAMGRGLDMSSTSTGAGYLSGQNNVVATYLGALDAYTLAYSLSGAGNSKFMLLTGTVNLYTYNAVISGIAYANASYNPILTWINASLNINLLDDFSGGVFYSILNGDDYIYGNSYVDIIKAGAGGDLIYGYGGNDTIYGESGLDCAGYRGVSSSYTVTYNSGIHTVRDLQNSRDGIDTLNSIEFLQFSDGFFCNW